MLAHALPRTAARASMAAVDRFRTILFCVALLGLTLALFGGVAVSAVLAVVAVPVAFPITTTVVILFFAGAYLLHRRRKREERRESGD